MASPSPKALVQVAATVTRSGRSASGFPSQADERPMWWSSCASVFSSFALGIAGSTYMKIPGGEAPVKTKLLGRGLMTGYSLALRRVPGGR